MQIMIIIEDFLNSMRILLCRELEDRLLREEDVLTSANLAREEGLVRRR
jgi:hypothetical protein